MKIIKAIGIGTFVATLLAGCASQFGAPRGERVTGDVVISSDIAFRRRSDSNEADRPEIMGWAPLPAFPQTGLRIIDRSVRTRVVATRDQPAVAGRARFTLGWTSGGSPTQVEILRQTWRLGAVNSTEFYENPQVSIANLGAVPNGYRTWVDPAPELNTQNCYRVKAGNGTFWSYSNLACAFTPDPNNPHAIGKVSLRLKVSTAANATTNDNVRVRLNYGIPGGSDGPVYTWLDAPETPFFTSGGEHTFMLLTPDIRDLSDITMIQVEVPGGDGLCLNEIELIADDTPAFRKTSPTTQNCGNGNPFEWAWHSGSINGSTVAIRFAELRNSSLWRNFQPRIFSGTVSATLPDGASFVGYTPSELIKKLDSTTGHNLKEDSSDTGSSRQFRNGTNDRTTVTRIDDRTARVKQHLRIADAYGCTVDAHPVYTLNIRSLNANGELVTGTNGPIESTKIESVLESPGIDSGGLLCTLQPVIGAFVGHLAEMKFESEFAAMGANDVGKPPENMRFCFPTDAADGGQSLDPALNNGGLAICFWEAE
jgi:hypothetical protein